MQHLIDVEQAWLLGKGPAAKRTGGGFARLSRGAAASLGNETEYYHNLEVRNKAVEQVHRGPAVPPPSVHGLRVGSSPSRSSVLWPDASPARWPDDSRAFGTTPGASPAR